MSRPVKMDQVKTENRYVVSAGPQPMTTGARQGHQSILLLRPVGGTLTREEAISLIAWLVIVAEIDVEELAAVIVRTETDDAERQRLLSEM